MNDRGRICLAEGIGTLILVVAGPGTAVLATGSLYLRIVAPFYVLFGAGMALYFASQGAGRMGLPVLAGTVRLAFVVVAGALAVALGAPLWAIFAVIAGGIVLFGGLIIAAVRAGRWEG